MVKTVLVKDVFETFCYFYIDDKTKHGFLIDPGADADKLLEEIAQNEWTIEKILLTHGHFDHTGAVQKISDQLGIPYFIHENGKEYLQRTKYNLSEYCQRHIVLENAAYLNDGDTLQLSINPEVRLQVLHTPGHTADSVVFYSQEDAIAFVGDTIFRGSIGNTQYPGGNMKQIQESIVETIFKLPENTVLLSGHSDATTVGREIKRYIR